MGDAGVYVALGWVGVVASRICRAPGVGAGALIVVGGLLYTVGAVIYAAPARPGPAVFGYHEIFHLLVIVAAATHYAAIAAYALPAS